MKLLALAIALAAFGCSKKDTPAPDPKPVDPTLAPTKPPEPKPTPVTADPATAKCIVQIKITADTITYDGGGVKGEMPHKAGGFPDMSPLKPAVGKCDANVWADDEISYQDVIAVMDQTVKIGITDIGLGSPTDKRTEQPRPATNSEPPAGWTWNTTRSPDGKLEITGRFDPNSLKDKLKQVPVIILTKTDASVFDKAVGKVSDSNLDLEIAKALPSSPKDPTAIVQADKDLPFSTIAMAVKAAQASGYYSVLFAVKNR